MNFDLSALREAAGEDEDLVWTLINIFREECPGLIDNIEQAIRGCQPQQLHEAAHKLKGTLGNMGAMAALDQAVALEAMGKNEDMQQATSAFGRLKSEIETLLDEINTLERAAAK